VSAPEPDREQVEQLIESERAELAATVDELSKRLDPSTQARALVARLRTLVQRWEVQAAAGAVAGAVAMVTVLRRRRSRRH
jgi:hypothetical protein